MIRAGRRPIVRTSDDAGSASIMVVAVLVAVALGAGAALGASRILVERSRVAGAADAAALAAADVVAGLVAGTSCEAAGRLATANGARLDGCSVDGAVVTVRVSSSVGLVPVSASATAGPPPPGSSPPAGSP